MARIRTIKPKFWDDIKIGRLSRDARLLYIGLWNFSDDIGVVIGDLIWIKSKIFPYDQIQVQQFEKWVNELVINGFICLLSYNEERFIYLPSFTRHQVINRPNSDDLNIPKVLIDKEKDMITQYSANHHGTFTDQSVLIIGKGKGKEYTPSNPPGDGTGQGSEGEPEPEKVDYTALMDCFNKMFDGKLPKVTTMTDKRKKAVKVRISEHGKKSIMTVFKNTLASPFLMGSNENDWQCGFDWIFRPNNFIKILEGNYLDHGKSDNTLPKAGSGPSAKPAGNKAAGREALGQVARAVLEQYKPEDGD